MIDVFLLLKMICSIWVKKNPKHSFGLV